MGDVTVMLQTHDFIKDYLKELQQHSPESEIVHPLIWLIEESML